MTYFRQFLTMNEEISKEETPTNRKDKIFNVRKLQYKHFEHQKYRKPNFSPLEHKYPQTQNSQHKTVKKGGQYNFQIAIISSPQYKQLNKRYQKVKEQYLKEKQQRLKQLKEKENELFKYQIQRQKLSVQRQRLLEKRDQIKEKLEQIRNRNEELRYYDHDRYDEYQMMSVDNLKNMILSLRYQNGVEIDPDTMTYEELLQLEQKIGNVSKGLSKSQFDKLVKNKCQKEEQLCSICYENVKEGQEMITLPCEHSFHEGCIDEWLKKEKICPNCKQQIL